ncbi:uncharacterized protein [Haliotis asinina]|uniref:uncharacterized protein n=1 Tax=Haliotis asinina TaxID=109174 RepID=UPI003531FB72
MALTSAGPVACFALMLVFVEGRGTCPPGRYWDHVLGKCDLCSSICEFMEQQGTVTSCENNCPGYKSSKNILSKPRDIEHIKDNHSESTYGLPIGVTVAASILIIGVIAGALHLRRSRRSRETSIKTSVKIEDTSAPMLSTGHTREDRREEEDNELGRVIPVNDVAV